MIQFVLDASVALSWCFVDEESAFTSSLRRRLDVNEVKAIVPTLWRLEVSNTLLVASRRKRIAVEQEVAFLTLLKSLPIEVVWMDDAREFEETHQIARRYNLTSYDAVYLEMALREQVPLATHDAHLRAAARLAGVSLLEDIWNTTQ